METWKIVVIVACCLIFPPALLCLCFYLLRKGIRRRSVADNIRQPDIEAQRHASSKPTSRGTADPSATFSYKQECPLPPKNYNYHLNNLPAKPDNLPSPSNELPLQSKDYSFQSRRLSSGLNRLSCKPDELKQIPNLLPLQTDILPSGSNISTLQSHRSNLHSQSLSAQQSRTPTRRDKSPSQTLKIVSPKKAAKLAAASFLVLDLHQFKLKKAMSAFKMFLHESLKNYTESQYKKYKRFINVITGRGKHSPDGIPVIKPAVENYLQVHDIKYHWDNPGNVRIDLRSITHKD